MDVSSVLRKIEVKPTDDEYEAIDTSRWGNRDVYPIPHDKRTYGVYAFVSSAGITTPGLIGFVLFMIMYFPIIYFVPAWKVQKLLEVQENGGSPGNLVAPAIKLSKAEAGFRVIQGITSVAGTYTGGSDRVSDWTRYGRRRHTSTPAIITLAVTVILTALVGIISTSALAERYGLLEWNPLIMLQWIQQTSYTPKCRAGTFFAGVGLLSVTTFVNYTQNCVSSGMDVAMLFPRYISQRRGAIIFSILGVLANPWRFLTQAETFITVLSSFGVFMSPAAAILIVDFWIVRRQKWNIPELYIPGGTYWFTAGVNWRAFIAYFLGMWPALPGFVNAVSSLEVDVVWRRFYQISFFFGYLVSAILFYIFNRISPPPGLGVQVSFHVDGTRILEEMPEGMKEEGLEKGVEVGVEKVSGS
ncbi:putative nicotinamide riboside transporter 1 [Lindgomyces ingoldianus]|uniref:Nicotinamide riboside transporter 1 n=1 Tax=Lindgomyces ingoldianus TaxID=673940 RepID=A0ACB6R6T2_9PLEO|nr:putative nicotinamide riboside transporter 1 [Lindgomyces ingoldianus]KAF2475009.1 putative nicotinamide riboside transporter 1 [Lindgomyces ingoldianus]